MTAAFVLALIAGCLIVSAFAATSLFLDARAKRRWARGQDRMLSGSERRRQPYSQAAGRQL